MKDYGGKAILGTNTRVLRMAKKKALFEQRLLRLAIRIHCAKKVKRTNPTAPTSTRIKQFASKFEEFEECLARNSAESERVKELGNVMFFAKELGREEDVAERDWDSIKKEYETAPFAMTTVAYGTPEFYIPKFNFAAVNGWNCDELGWIFGPDKDNVRKTFKRICEDKCYGEFWADRLEKLKCASMHDGDRYWDGVFSFYFNFRQYKYLSSLKEALKCGKKVDDFEACDIDDLRRFKAVVDYYNSIDANGVLFSRSPEKSNNIASCKLPRADYWDAIFDVRLGDRSRFEWEW